MTLTLGSFVAPAYTKNRTLALLHKNRELFRFLADELNSPWAASVCRYLACESYNRESVSTAYRSAQCTAFDALKHLNDHGSHELALRLGRFTCDAEPSVAGLDCLEEAMSEVAARKDEFPKRLTV
jgi:hypothetical protein